jgi:hypothetical protein
MGTQAFRPFGGYRPQTADSRSRERRWTIAEWAFQSARAGPQYVAQTFQPAGEETPFAPTSHPCQPAPLASPAPHQANQSPGSALCQRAGAGGDCQARHPDRNVHRSKFTCAGTIPCQATCPSSQSSFHLRPTARPSPAPRIGAASGAGACWAVFFK